MYRTDICTSCTSLALTLTVLDFAMTKRAKPPTIGAFEEAWTPLGIGPGPWGLFHE